MFQQQWKSAGAKLVKEVYYEAKQRMQDGFIPVLPCAQPSFFLKKKVFSGIVDLKWAFI